jgi:hypothetical protein
MAKQFKKILMANSNEVSLCSKYNSGANKQTEFEIIKDKNGSTDNIRQAIEAMVKMVDLYNEETPKDEYNAFKDFLNYWLEYDVNQCYYNLLNDALQQALSQMKYREDISKEEKIDEYRKVFDMFIEEYKKMPITKTQDGKYEVSLASSSHIQDVEANPQNETDNITKEKTSKMENEEKMSLIEKAFDLIKSAFSLEKTETPAEEQPEVQPEATEEVQEEVQVEETVETPAENAEEPAQEAEVEAPVVDEVEAEETQAEEVEEVVEEAQEEVAEAQAPAEEVDVDALVKAKLEVEKELAEIKKANEEKQIQIEKMEFVQKAKDEYAMLAGTAEEIGAKLYSISKSSLDEEVKTFIFDQLKKNSVKNSQMTEEIGSINKNAGDMTDEEIQYAKAEEIAKSKGISIKQALRQVK